jgi:hypothetical protein
MVTLILTTTVFVQLHKNGISHRDPFFRRDIYVTAIKQWLEKTDFTVVVVDNNGYYFPELQEQKEKYADRFQVLTFTESQVVEAAYLKNRDNKGESELYAIHWAYYNSKLIRDSRFVVKVTGRFFIPGFADFLSTVDLENSDVLRQEDNMRFNVLGCHIKNFHILFNKYSIFRGFLHSQDVRETYKYRVNELFKKIIVCPRLEIPTEICEKCHCSSGATEYI